MVSTHCCASNRIEIFRRIRISARETWTLRPILLRFFFSLGWRMPFHVVMNVCDGLPRKSISKCDCKYQIAFTIIAYTFFAVLHRSLAAWLLSITSFLRSKWARRECEQKKQRKKRKQMKNGNGNMQLYPYRVRWNVFLFLSYRSLSKCIQNVKYPCIGRFTRSFDSIAHGSVWSHRHRCIEWDRAVCVCALIGNFKNKKLIDLFQKMNRERQREIFLGISRFCSVRSDDIAYRISYSGAIDVFIEFCAFDGKAWNGIELLCCKLMHFIIVRWRRHWRHRFVFNLYICSPQPRQTHTHTHIHEYPSIAINLRESWIISFGLFFLLLLLLPFSERHLIAV